MKTYFYFLVFLTAIFNQNDIKAQQPWAKPGAHWFYAYGDSSAFGVYGYAEITKVGDTLSNNILCDVLNFHYEYTQMWLPYNHKSFTGYHRYTYISNDTVYIDNGNSFDVLFMINPSPGSYWLTGPDETGNCDGDSIFVDSVQVVNINGFTMNRIVPIPFDWWPTFPQTLQTVNFNHPIYERFGSTGYFLPVATCVTDISEGPMCYYSDSLGFVYSNMTDRLCGAVPTGLATLIIETTPTLTPSLTSGKLKIDIPFNKTQREILVEILDLSGKLQLLQKANENEINLDVTNFSNGIYICRIQFDQKVYTMKFSKVN